MIRYHTRLRTVLFGLVLAASVLAHDAPARVTVAMHLKPEATAMRVLVRIPLEAVRDVDFPAIEGGYLDLKQLAPQLPGLAKVWVADSIELYENGSRAGAALVAATQISNASDRSFASYEQAEARLKEQLPANGERLFWKQVFFDIALDVPIQDPSAQFSIRPAFANLGESVQTALHFKDRAFLLSGDQEVFPIDPSWMQAAWLFVRMGFVHILEGADHLLFLLCLVIPCRRLRPLIWIVTSFTVAHSLTLIASALNMAPDALWFPPLVEFLIAASILFTALANIVVGGSTAGNVPWNSRKTGPASRVPGLVEDREADPFALQRILAFVFGLVHGFGFAFSLRESMQFAGSHLAAALLSFNIGVELGQLAAIGILIPVTSALFRTVVKNERIGLIILSSLVAHTGWHWMWERGAQLSKFSFYAASWSTPAALALLLRWVLLFMATWAVFWVGRRLLRLPR